MDLYLFNLINQYALKWSFLDTLGIILAEYLGYALILVIVVLAILNFRKNLKPAIQAVLAGILARFGFVSFIRWILPRSRPFVNNDVNLLFEHNTSSFPSGHVAFFFAISTIVYFYNRKLGGVFFLASFLIVTARVFSGIHWPSDIFAGAIVGIFSGWLIHKLMVK